jgi:putative oxidoreductase
MDKLFSWMDRHRDLGVLLLRIFIGIRLIYGVADNIVSWEHMLKFRDFLHQFGFPFPLASAMLSVYAQFLAGVLILLGLQIRYAALLMIVNFLVALLMVHFRDTFEGMTPALAILFSSILLLFQGAGKYSLRLPGRMRAR